MTTTFTTFARGTKVRINRPGDIFHDLECEVITPDTGRDFGATELKPLSPRPDKDEWYIAPGREYAPFFWRTADLVAISTAALQRPHRRDLGR